MIEEARTEERAISTQKGDLLSVLTKRKARKERRASNRRFIAAMDGEPKRLTRAQREKKAKKEGPVLWSKVVRARDGRCVMCGKTETLQAHHWLFFKSHSARLALEPANGVTLCYSCHIFKIHRRGDADFVMRLFERMTEIVGVEIITEMRRLGNNPVPLSLEEREEIVEALRKLLPEAPCQP